MSEQAFEGWVILEIMGHRKLAGSVTAVELAGARFLRIDVPSEPPVTQFYSPQAIYGLTPVSEAVARGYARSLVAAPVSRYELSAGPSEQETELARSLEIFTANYRELAERFHLVMNHALPFEECDIGSCRRARESAPEPALIDEPSIQDAD